MIQSFIIIVYYAVNWYRCRERGKIIWREVDFKWRVVRWEEIRDNWWRIKRWISSFIRWWHQINIELNRFYEYFIVLWKIWFWRCSCPLPWINHASWINFPLRCIAVQEKMHFTGYQPLIQYSLKVHKLVLYSTCTQQDLEASLRIRDT